MTPARARPAVVRARRAGVLTRMNHVLRHPRRRLVALGAVFALAGAVLTAHGVLADGHMGDAVVMCVALAQSAIFAAGGALGTGTLLRARARLLPAPAVPAPAVLAAPLRVRARAGPRVLQVFRL